MGKLLRVLAYLLGVLVLVVTVGFLNVSTAPAVLLSVLVVLIPWAYLEFGGKKRG